MLGRHLHRVLKDKEAGDQRAMEAAAVLASHEAQLERTQEELARLKKAQEEAQLLRQETAVLQKEMQVADIRHQRVGSDLRNVQETLDNERGNWSLQWAQLQFQLGLRKQEAEDAARQHEKALEEAKELASREAAAATEARM